MHLLVVEDDPRLSRLLRRLLEEDKHVVELATDGESGLEIALEAAGIEAIVLDIGLPDISGLEVARRIRASGSDVAILMLTARDTVGDRVSGLDAGADDYLAKPFDLEELLARIRALIRRSGMAEEHGELALADLRMDTRGHELWRGDREIDLTRTEWQLLLYFMTHPGLVLTRGQLWRHVWGYDFDPGSNTLEVFVGYLRRKTEAGDEPRLIHTVRGTVYVIREPRRA
jgi:two-component system, OmpR family, response regulator MprA